MATPQKLRCLVDKITDHGDHVYTVDLKPERPAPRFKPGQFLHLTLDDYDPSGFWPESRVFSIASSSTLRDHLKISYSVRGRYTARMENELKEGVSVWVKLPYGDFVISDTNNIVLLAGGTGITAFIAFIENFTASCNSIFLAYGARKPELILYRDVIDAKACTNDGFKALYFAETDNRSDVSDTTHSQSPECLTGCLSLEKIWSRLERQSESKYYIAGPPAMIQALTANLRNKGIEPEKIKIDAWE